MADSTPTEVLFHEAHIGNAKFQLVGVDNHDKTKLEKKIRITHANGDEVTFPKVEVPELKAIAAFFENAAAKAHAASN